MSVEVQKEADKSMFREITSLFFSVQFNKLALEKWKK